MARSEERRVGKECSGSTDVEYLSGNQKTTINLNPLHPFTLVNTKPKGKQKFRCRKCGRIFEVKL